MIKRIEATVRRHPVHALALVAALAGTPAAFAAASPADGTSPDAPARIRPIVGVVLTGTIASNKSNVTNPDGSTATGSLSGRYEALAGAEFPIDPNGLTLRMTLGIHASAGFSSSAGSEHFTRFPFEATFWYPLSDQVRIGGGARYAFHPRFSGAGGNKSDGLNATPAPMIALDYRLMPHLWLDMRYVYERYEQPSGTDLEGSHWGVGLMATY